MKNKPLWLITDSDSYELAVTDNFQIACTYASIHDGKIQAIGELASEWISLRDRKLTGRLKDINSSWIRLIIESEGKTVGSLDFGLDDCLPIGITIEENRVNAYKFAYDNDIEVIG